MKAIRESEEKVRAFPYPFPPFGPAEYAARITDARRRMRARGMAALLITGEANFRYFTGYNAQGWISPTRPMFFVLPEEKEPVGIVPSGSAVAMARTSWLTDVRTWPAPRPADDGVTLLVDALRSAVGVRGTVGAEFGPEHHLRMPYLDFERIRSALPSVTFIDGSPITRDVRMVKSPGEIARMRAIGRIVSEGFESLPGLVSLGMSERDMCLVLQLAILRGGADRFPYMIAASGPEGYRTINTNPTDRALSSGDVLIIDTGSTIDGYFCDFDRNFAFGELSLRAREANRLVYEATEAGIAAVRPDITTSDVWHAMAECLGKDRVKDASVGRMGHGLGLQLTEPPSIHPDDHTPLRPGMVITIEPGIGYRAVDGTTRVMVHEENLVVTDTGAELITCRAPRDMPVIA